MVIWLRTWQLGIKSLLLYPMRSMLTVLGIFIGVASVIWLMAIGEGISLKAQEQIESLGANNIIVRTIKPANPPMGSSGQRRGMPKYGLTRKDYDRISNGHISTIVAHMPVREIQRTFARGPREIGGRLVGTTPLYATMSHIDMDRGRFISEIDNRYVLRHCVISAAIAEKLFPSEDPVGKTIRIQANTNHPGDPYTIIGVAKPRGATAGIGSSMAGQDFTYDVYIPIATLWSHMRDAVVTRKSGNFEGEIVELSQMTLQVRSRHDVKETAKIIENELERERKGMEDFTVVVPLELLEQAETTRIMFNVFMGLIAAISLVVGGIGIMNIMLATVTERTREIGIRRALGAKQGDIIRQFLVETIVLSMVGGVVGVLVGLSCRPVTIYAMDIIKTRMPEVIESLPPIVQSIQPVIVPLSIPLAFLISVVIGVVFGLYPAYRAAMMDPIEALRHE